MGSDVVFGTIGDFVAKFEIFHELKQFIPHVCVLFIAPDFGEIGLSETSEILIDLFGIENFINSGGAPFGLEDDNIFEDGIVLEMQADTKIVKIAAKLKCVFLVFETVGVAEIEEFGLGDVIAGVGFEGCADAHPGFR